MPFIKRLTTAIAASLLTTLPLLAARPAAAVTFQQVPVDAQNFIAIATPFGSGQYSLLIVEQIPGRQQCWQESGTAPVSVGLLLNQFDFTGHCNRSVDSNGYSVRIGNQDLGLDYLLRVVQRGDELWLVGTPRIGSQRSLPEILIGRSRGLIGGPVKLFLEDGWQFARRAYNGQALGHVYLAASSSQAAVPAPRPAPTTRPQTPVPPAQPTLPTELPPPERELIFTPPR
ncbi:MAG: DUF3747 domain-containing protein [Spirulinaceae cyanobacterium SM2_1_0]|nr:DUF3747 domain-containing protein [Spirulinaceae cyanobacterium SM2_1_0]